MKRSLAAAMVVSVLSASTIAMSAVDVQLIQAAYTDPVEQGKPVVYGLQVVNLGAKRATGVSTRSPLPAGAVFVSADPGCRYVKKSSKVKCSYGALPPGGGTATRSITLVPTRGGEFTLTSTVLSDEIDLDLTNNSATTRLQLAVVPYDLYGEVTTDNTNCGLSACDTESQITLFEAGAVYLEATLHRAESCIPRSGPDLCTSKGHFKPTFVRPYMLTPHEISLSLSDGTNAGAGDTILWTGSTSDLAQLIAMKKSIPIQYLSPPPVNSCFAHFLRLELDSANAVAETDEGNNRLSIYVLYRGCY